MTRRERLSRCYRCEEVDRPAVYSRTGFPANDPSYDRLKGYLQAHTELKRIWNCMGRIERPYSVRTAKEPYSEDFVRRRMVMQTPGGDLEETRLVSLKGQPGAQERYLIGSREDAEKYLSLPLPEVGGDVSPFFSAVREMGDAGIVEVSLGQNTGFVNKLFGSEMFAIMSVTDRDVIHALCERQMTILLKRLDFLLGQGVGPFFNTAGQEQVTPPLHGPADFYDFNVKYDKPVLDRVHEAGGRVHIHCHGSIKKVFQGFVDMGADVLHPFEAPPMGDITAAEAKARARGKLCLEGNIQINRMYEVGPEEIGAETEALMRTVFDDRRGLIVCPTASPYIRGEGEVCFPQYKAMIDAVLGWRG